jgi:protein-tyrosine phosphatase
MQITAGSLTGRFGARPQHWAEKMLKDGIVHVLATDAHNLTSRAPLLSEGKQAASKIVGLNEADALVNERPKAIWNNIPANRVSHPPAFNVDGKYSAPPTENISLLNKLFRNKFFK